MSDNPPTVPSYPPVPPSAPPKKGLWGGLDKTQKIVAIVAASVIGACVVCASCAGVLGALNPSKTSASATQTSGSSVAVATKAPAGPTATIGPTATTAPTATPKPVYAHFDGDGIYQVGKDIQPGTYRTRNASPGCYYERLSSFDGSFNSIIANNTTDNPAIVTIAATDKGFSTQGCDTWTKDLSRITSSKTSFDDGMYIVNTDISPGQYKSSTPADNCYWERLSNFSNGFSGIIANNNTSTATIVTIRSSDKGFSSEGCGPWTKI